MSWNHAKVKVIYKNVKFAIFVSSHKVFGGKHGMPFSALDLVSHYASVALTLCDVFTVDNTERLRWCICANCVKNKSYIGRTKSCVGGN